MEGGKAHHPYASYISQFRCSTSKLIFTTTPVVKRKLRNAMAQKRLDASLTIFIEQEIANSLDGEEIIDECKTLTTIQRR